MTDILARIKRNGKEWSDNELHDVILKAQEELGEVCGEDLRCRGFKPHKQGKNPVEEHAEESCDLLIVVLDLCMRQMTLEQIQTTVEKKLVKWESYIGKTDTAHNQDTTVPPCGILSE